MSEQQITENNLNTEQNLEQNIDEQKKIDNININSENNKITQGKFYLLNIYIL
jgi:hypothetical protein